MGVCLKRFFTFNYSLNDIESLLEGLKETADKYEIQHDLSVSDAVQEISRGCLRQRNINKKQNVFLLGDIRVLEGVIEYMEIKNAVKL